MQLRQDDVDRFEASRNRLEAIAYRMLGSASEAEDVVQEAFLRWEGAERDRIEVPEAWLTKVLTNLCLNQLTSARARRESYVGMWMPEPLLDGDPMLGPADTAEQRESVSLAVLTLMERLSPNERAVYVLREAFGYRHREIGEFLDLTEAASQQIFSRAKRHLATDRARVPVEPAAARRIVEQFLAAADNGDTGALVELLTDDATGIGDGGGRVPARAKPIVGASALAKFMRGLFKASDAKREMIGGSPDLYLSSANGSPALVVLVGDRVVGVMALDFDGDRISFVRNQVNPAKLRRAARRRTDLDLGEPIYHAW